MTPHGISDIFAWNVEPDSGLYFIKYATFFVPWRYNANVANRSLTREVLTQVEDDGEIYVLPQPLFDGSART